MHLVRSRAAIDDCLDHIRSLDKPDPQIEAILAHYACTVLYAEVESRIVDVVSERAGRASDDRGRAFARVSAGRVIRSIGVGDLAGIAGHFHQDCKSAFRESLDDDIVAAWGQLVINRHSTAHETDTSGLHLTLRDVEGSYAAAVKVVDEFRRSLDHLAPVAAEIAEQT